MQTIDRFAVGFVPRATSDYNSTGGVALPRTGGELQVDGIGAGPELTRHDDRLLPDRHDYDMPCRRSPARLDAAAVDVSRPRHQLEPMVLDRWGVDSPGALWRGVTAKLAHLRVLCRLLPFLDAFSAIVHGKEHERRGDGDGAGCMHPHRS